ncbi:Riboflavin biosynthesis protein RibBA [compost metagenome]
MHLALIKGEIRADEPTLVRVHNMDPLRDLLSVKRPGRWSLREAMIKVAEQGSGVVLLLNHAISGNELLALLEEQLGGGKPAEPTTYSTVGAGSQILRDLGVRKMRLLSSPVRFNAISGFDLEVVEYVTCE